MILDRINNPGDIRNIPPEKYGELADDIRKCIIKNVAENGGHLSSSLGVVELTIALHLNFNIGKDKILWDVGHQSYAHKILTGRRDQFNTLRQEGGISGFPLMSESPYDDFGMGHASTALSAAIGYATARDLKGEDNYVVAVIGDGAATGGMVFEAINNIHKDSNLIIILNDNEMSISPNVGGMSNVLNNIRTGHKYTNLKYSIKDKLSRIPDGDRVISRIGRTKDSIKTLFVPGMLFEDMGLTYLGPVDGHDIDKMSKMLLIAKRVQGAVLLHIHTKKGKGYPLAEKHPSYFHGVAPFNIENGRPKEVSEGQTYSEVFSDKFINMAENDDKILGISAAMADGTGLKRFAKRFPDRFFDVGIAEEHAVTFAAGLAAGGFKPYVAIYSTFLQRAFDQILHDVCIQNLPVRFIIERGGIVGPDGITHQGIFDLSYMSIIPNMTIMAPMNGKELDEMLDYSRDYEGPIAIRIPKGTDTCIYEDAVKPIEYARSCVLRKGERVVLIGIGSGTAIADKIINILSEKGITAGLVNARFAKPIDKELIGKLSDEYDIIATVEENVLSGGFGEHVLSYVNDINPNVKVLNFALKDEFIPHGKCEQLLNEYGLNPSDIADKIIKTLG